MNSLVVGVPAQSSEHSVEGSFSPRTVGPGAPRASTAPFVRLDFSRVVDLTNPNNLEFFHLEKTKQSIRAGIESLEKQALENHPPHKISAPIIFNLALGGNLLPESNRVGRELQTPANAFARIVRELHGNSFNAATLDLFVGQSTNMDRTCFRDVANVMCSTYVRIPAHLQKSFAGFVCATGCDSMHEMAAYLAQHLGAAPFSVALVGSDEPISSTGSDGKANLDLSYKYLNHLLNRGERKTVVVLNGQVLAAAAVQAGQEHQDRDLIGSVLEVPGHMPLAGQAFSKRERLSTTKKGDALRDQRQELSPVYASRMSLEATVQIVEDRGMHRGPESLKGMIEDAVRRRGVKAVIFETNNAEFRTNDKHWNSVVETTRALGLALFVTTNRPSCLTTGFEPHLRTLEKNACVLHMTTAAAAEKLMLAIEMFGDNLSDTKLRGAVFDYMRFCAHDQHEQNPNVVASKAQWIQKKNFTFPRPQLADAEAIVRTEQELKSFKTGPSSAELAFGFNLPSLGSALELYQTQQDPSALVLRALGLRTSQLPNSIILEVLSQLEKANAPHIIFDHGEIGRLNEKEKFFDQVDVRQKLLEKFDTDEVVPLKTVSFGFEDEAGRKLFVVSTAGDVVSTGALCEAVKAKLNLSVTADKLVQNPALEEFLPSATLGLTTGIIGPITQAEVYKEVPFWGIVAPVDPGRVVHLALSFDASLALRWRDLEGLLRQHPELNFLD
jgi:hypothetical protein